LKRKLKGSLEKRIEMAFTVVNQAITKLVEAEKEAVIDALIAHIGTKFTIDDSLQEAVDEFKKSLKSTVQVVKKTKKGKDVGEKKKRAPSVYNLYVKDVMAGKHPEHAGKQKMGFASDLWKTDDMASYLKEHVEELKKENVELKIEELYAMAKSAYLDENGLEEPEEVEKEVVVKVKAPKGKAVETVKGKGKEEAKGKGKAVKGKEVVAKGKAVSKVVVKEPEEPEPEEFEDADEE